LPSSPGSPPPRVTSFAHPAKTTSTPTTARRTTGDDIGIPPRELRKRNSQDTPCVRRSVRGVPLFPAPKSAPRFHSPYPTAAATFHCGHAAPPRPAAARRDAIAPVHVPAIALLRGVPAALRGSVHDAVPGARRLRPPHGAGADQAGLHRRPRSAPRG